MSTTSSRSADALYCIGYWLLDQARHEDATHVFRTMLHTSPSDERGWLGLGTCHERAGELNTAVRLYEVARHACPGSVRARLALARVLRRVDREDEARSAYEAAGELADEADDLQLASSIAHEARLS